MDDGTPLHSPSGAGSAWRPRPALRCVAVSDACAAILPILWQGLTWQLKDIAGGGRQVNGHTRYIHLALRSNVSLEQQVGSAC
jgi:hypothetical protein